MRRLVTFFLAITLLAAVATPVAAQSPTTTEELLSGMVTEEVEPGVFRVVHDGVRDLSYPLGGWGYVGFIVDVTPDGGVWLSAMWAHGLYRLGEERVFEDPAGLPSLPRGRSRWLALGPRLRPGRP